LSWTNPPSGPNIAIISNAGGPAVLATDTIIASGLKLAEFSSVTRQKLTAVLPPIASIRNPVDIMGDALADRFAQSLEIVLQDESVNSVIIILTPQLMTQVKETAELVAEISQKYSKPVLCSFIGGATITSGQKILNDHHLPCFSFAEKAIKTLSSIWSWQQWRQNQPTVTPSRPAVTSLNIPAPPAIITTNLKEAKTFIQNHPSPFVLKISSSDLLHKSDIGGVITNIENSEQLQTAWDNLQQKISLLSQKTGQPISLQIQQQIVGGVEVILGIKRDPTFGPVFGAGGQLVELIQDKNLHLLSVDETIARQMVSRSKIYPLLSGYRGTTPYDLAPLYDAMIHLANFFESSPQISDIEINPLIITHQGIWAVDTKIISVTP
jgi:acyl-CoA synthetase (NDP forming)